MEGILTISLVRFLFFLLVQTVLKLMIKAEATNATRSCEIESSKKVLVVSDLAVSDASSARNRSSIEFLVDFKNETKRSLLAQNPREKKARNATSSSETKTGPTKRPFLKFETFSKRRSCPLVALTISQHPDEAVR
jgi:hypothetical protein